MSFWLFNGIDFVLSLLHFSGLALFFDRPFPKCSFPHDWRTPVGLFAVPRGFGRRHLRIEGRHVYLK